MKLKKKNNDFLFTKIYFLISFFLIISFALSNNIFRKFYNILTTNHNNRIIQTYGFCGGESIGFVKMLKKKYQFKTNPTIINFKNNPGSLWSIYDNKLGESDGSDIIFLNYSNLIELNFKKKNKTYQTINKNEYVGEISKIIFNIKNEKIRLDNNILIYTLNAKGNKNLIYKKKFSGYFNKKEITNINHKTDKFNSEKYPIYIEIEDLQNELLNNISSISLILKNKYILNDYKIIEQKDNCYYVNK